MILYRAPPFPFVTGRFFGVTDSNSSSQEKPMRYFKLPVPGDRCPPVEERTPQLGAALASRENTRKFKQAVIDALPANVAVIDPYGTIVAVNKPWLKFGEEGESHDPSLLAVGSNYLEVCRKAIVSELVGAEDARKALTGIQSVLGNDADSYTMDYPCHAPTKKQWFRMTVARPGSGFSGAVISHIEISGLKQLEEERREYTCHLVDAIEAERIRIARELHDALGQALTLFSFDIVRLQKDITSEDAVLAGRFSVLNEDVQRMAVTVQQLCTNLRPSILDDLGLAAAIEWKCEDFSRRSGINCRVRWKGNPCRTARCATTIFRIVQESLHNIGKHSGATAAAVVFERKRSGCRIEIRDNGKGFNAGVLPSGRGYGIMGMRERAESLGAGFTITGRPNRGTVITLVIPCGRTEPDDEHSDR